MSVRTYREGVRQGVTHTREMAGRIVRKAIEGGADASTAVDILNRNVDRACRTLGRKATGVAKPLIKASGGVRKTGKGSNRHRAALDRAARDADRVTGYRKIRAIVERERAACKGRSKSRTRELKGALRLAAKLADGGEYAEATRVLRAV